MYCVVTPGTQIVCHQSTRWVEGMFPALRNPQLILPMAVPPPEVDDIEFQDPNCWASTGRMACHGLVEWQKLQQLTLPLPKYSGLVSG